METQHLIKNILIELDESPSRWRHMTLRQILTAFDQPPYVVYWGAFAEEELNTVFTDFN